MVKKGQASVVKADFGHPHASSDDLSVDKILVRAVKNNDETAFELLLERYQNKIHRFAYRMLGDVEAANDVAQETFLRFYTSLKNDSEIKHLAALLYRIAKNCCIDIKRKQRIRSIAPEEMPVEHRTAFQVLDDKERQIKIEKALQKLPANQQLVIVLRHTESLSYHDIAEVMTLSVSAVESLLFRARSKLKKLLEHQELLNSASGN